jgi:hypothetical protein
VFRPLEGKSTRFRLSTGRAPSQISADRRQTMPILLRVNASVGAPKAKARACDIAPFAHDASPMPMLLIVARCPGRWRLRPCAPASQGTAPCPAIIFISPMVEASSMTSVRSVPTCQPCAWKRWTSCQLLALVGDDFWNGVDWELNVLDEDGLDVLNLRMSARR